MARSHYDEDWMPMRCARGVVLLIGSACAMSCSESHSVAVDDAGATVEAIDDEAAACTTGPVYTADAQLEQGSWEDAGVRCTPHCDSEEPREWLSTGKLLYGLDALPSGACASNRPPCSMDVGLPCNDQPARIWLNVVCKCPDGNWSCAGSYMGGGVCGLGAGDESG